MIARLAIGTLRTAAAVLTRRTIRREDVSSVALIELTGLGDVVSLLPALPGFQALFPTAEFHLIVDSSMVTLLRSMQIPAKVHGIAGAGSAKGTLDAIQRVRNMHVTLACSMSPPRRNALVALASGATAVAGYLRYTDSLTPYLVETPVEGFGVGCEGGIVFGKDHISERALKICRALGLREIPVPGTFTLSPSTVEQVRFDLLYAGMLPPRGYAVVHPFAGWKFRRWPESSFIAMVDGLLAAGVGTAVFLWEEERDGACESLRSHFAGDRRVLFASRLGLLQSAVLLAGADVFVGNDSGPLHLAAALGVPVVGLFGPSTPALTAPRAMATALWLYHETACSPCDQRKCVRPDDPCMNAIRIEEVLTATMAAKRGAANA
jgi:ADP-heptose:LPS heptosyltransferase